MSHSVPTRPLRGRRSASAPGSSVVADGSLFGGIAATFSASCCVLPLLMVPLGVGSALATNLAAFTAAQPYLVAVTLVLIGTSVSHHLMPTDACQYFLDCPRCRTVVRPKAGDCCVFCSYGSVPCPPKQRGAGCGI